MVRYRHRVLHETTCRVLVLKAGGALTGFKVNYQVEGGSPATVAAPVSVASRPCCVSKANNVPNGGPDKYLGGITQRG